jgi:hypothetical protein
MINFVRIILSNLVKLVDKMLRTLNVTDCDTHPFPLCFKGMSIFCNYGVK